MEKRTLSAFGAAIIAAICLAWSVPCEAGWGHQAHSNLVREAVRILPIFDYEMCLYYKEDLIKGAIEGEIHFKYRAQGVGPRWMNDLSAAEIEILNGIPVEPENLDDAASFFGSRLEELRLDVVQARRRYSEVFFELGYLLHSMNNILIPLNEEGNFPEQYLASRTQDIEIRTEKVEFFAELEPWLRAILSEKLSMRQKWSDLARPETRDEFIAYSARANEFNIYSIAALIHYVLAESFGPAHPEARAHVAEIHERQLNANGGRKPGV